MTEIKADQFDDLLTTGSAAAIVFHRNLKPVEGMDAWIFPPTFAHSESTDEDDEGSGGSYQIDLLPDDKRRNVCLIDSVGSQANRMEPLFKQDGYKKLVPQMVIKMANGDEVNMLDAGHRAADAIVRFSKVYGPKLSCAFNKYLTERDCSGLVKLAPTSLIFGVWDSRGTGAKIQRIVRSVIRAYDVIEAKRSATYRAAYDYTGNGVIDPKHDTGSGKNNPLSEQGFKYSLATQTHGGVLVKDEIRQEAVINLIALRMLSTDLATRRYLLGLALVALSHRNEEGFNLREGCLLCAASKEDFDGYWKVVNLDSTEDDSRFKSLTHDLAKSFAELAAEDMKFESLPRDEFDRDTAEKWLALPKKKRKVLGKTKHPAKAIEDEAVVDPKKKAVAGPADPAE
jgi:CRISPR-associated protein Csb1